MKYLIIKSNILLSLKANPAFPNNLFVSESERFSAMENVMAGVYGPPEVFGMQMPPVFVPEDNCEPDVYGPPASFEEPADSVSSTEYLPSVNVEPNVYGPPEVMGSSSQN